MNFTKKDEYNVAIVGASGVVGQEFIKILEERRFPVDTLKLFASERSIGKRVTFYGREAPIDELNDDSFNGVDIALFSAGGKVSERFCPIAASSGAVVIDNTSAFRMEEDVPLIIPEVNIDKLPEYSRRGIISNPNCSTIQLVVVLKPILDNVGIKRVVVSSYQSTSGAGRRAMEELSNQTVSIFSGRDINTEIFQKRIAFNCIPQIGSFEQNGYTVEEMKIINETKKILSSNIPITATAVRVPVFYAHAESVNVETFDSIDREELMDLLRESPGIKLMDNVLNNEYPTSIDAAGRDEVFVGRIRKDESVRCGFDMWIVADNIRKGAALNAIQIAEHLIKRDN